MEPHAFYRACRAPTTLSQVIWPAKVDGTNLGFTSLDAMLKFTVNLLADESRVLPNHHCHHLDFIRHQTLRIAQVQAVRESCAGKMEWMCSRVCNKRHTRQGGGREHEEDYEQEKMKELKAAGRKQVDHALEEREQRKGGKRGRGMQVAGNR